MNKKEPIKISLKTALLIVIIAIILIGVSAYVSMYFIRKHILKTTEDKIYYGLDVYNEEDIGKTIANSTINGHNYYQNYYIQNEQFGIFNQLGLNWIEIENYDEFLTYFEKIKNLYEIDYEKISENINEDFFIGGKVAIIEYSANVQDCLDIDFSRSFSGQTTTAEMKIYFENPINDEVKIKSELHILTSPKYMTVYEPVITRETKEEKEERERKEIRTWETIAKPIIYLYPEKETNVSVVLNRSEKITCSYPKYATGWNVLAKPNGDLIDLNNNKNLYALYYECENDKIFEIQKNGFVIKSENVAEFLEDKLAILGLTDREKEEFIVYWLPKLEANKYNYIRFATIEEINESMPISISPAPDTLIRILMIFKGLDEPIEVEEQKIESIKREGFVAIEWGGTEIK